MARSNLELPGWPEESSVRRPDITPGGVLDGWSQYSPARNIDLVLNESADNVPWTVREGGSQQPAIPVFEEAIPFAPPGISVDKNILRAEQVTVPWWKPAKPAKYELMMELFPASHEMDYKKADPKYRDFGNFNYGAFGSALGLSPYEVHSGAGYQQIRDKNWKPEYGIPGLLPPFGDNKRDYAQIEAGIRYYQTHRAPK